MTRPRKGSVRDAPPDEASENARRQIEMVRAQLACIVEHSADAIIGKDLEGRVTSWNRAAERMYGYTEAEMLGQPLTILLPPDRPDEVMQILDRLRRGEEVEHHETIRMTRDGRRLNVDITASPIRDLDGALTGVSAIVRDITQRRQRERAMRESEARLQIAKKAAGLGIYDYDPTTGCIDWDDRVRELWGLGPDEPVDYDVFLAGLHPDDREATQVAVDHALDPEGDGVYHAEYRVQARGSGTIRRVEATGIATFENGEAVRLVGAVRDVTDDRVIEEALKEADRRKDEFLATLGHELRNPLAALVTAVSCLRSGAPPNTTEELYAIMDRQTGHMSSLLDDLLDIGRITRGDIELRPSRIELRDLIAHAFQTIHSEIETRGHRIEIAIEPPDLEIVADPVRLEQIIINLISNAAKYTAEPGTITVRGRAIEDAVELSIQDTGIGFATPYESRRAFDLFYQARKGSGGLGIGLSLVKSLVGLHGGDIDVASEGANLGSEVRITLPLELHAVPEPCAPRPNGTQDLNQLRVLIVDDHEDSLAVLSQLLSKRYQVRTATNGTEGLEEAERFRPHAILLDLALPDMSGFEVAASLAELPDLRDALMIAITGFGDAETAEQVANSGFDEHLTKPVDLESLFGLLERTAAALPD